MGKLTKSFTDAFDKGSKKKTVFGEGHRLQLDALQGVVDEINAEGVFSAEITSLGKSVPVLEIQHNVAGYGEMFFIDFGYEPFGETRTLKLSTTLARTPLGEKPDGYNDKPEGYSLQFDNERDAFLKLIGESLAKKVNKLQLDAAAIAYMKSKKTPNP